MDRGSEQMNSQPTEPVNRPGTGQTPLKEVLDFLQANIQGRVISPTDAGYDQARTPFYGGFDRHPAVIVRVAGVEDMVKTIASARDAGLELAVRSGGHSAAGFCVTEGGIVLDLGNRKDLYIDPHHKTAWAETGLRAGEFTQAAGIYSLATGFGDTGSVGIGGITLGGGVGYLVRKHGLTIDNLLAADIVTADGQLHQVDAAHEPDLFWAIRGGGGNFGVAARLKYKLHPLGQAVGGMLFLPAEARVIANLMEEAHNAPEEFSMITNVMPAPPMPFLPPELHGKLVVFALMLYAGDVDTGMQTVERFRRLAQPLADQLRPLRYPEMFPSDEGGYHPTAVSQTMFMDDITREKAAEMIDFLQQSDAPMRVAQLRPLGGAFARVPEDSTAFAHRKSRNMVNLAAFYNGPDEKPGKAEWLQRFSSAMLQSDVGAYVNFLENVGEERIKAAYPGQTWDRLRTIKARYDPDNLFCLNQNIPPAKGM